MKLIANIHVVQMKVLEIMIENARKTGFDSVSEHALKVILERYRGLVEENEQLKRFKTFFDELYGQGLEVSNWHQNGDTEPFDNFHESAESEMTAIQRSQEGKVHEQ